jgi:hypothetical protein
MTTEAQQQATIEWLITDRDKYRQALLHGIANLDNPCDGCGICEFIKRLHEARHKPNA